MQKMIAPQLITNLAGFKLVRPDMERDPPLSVQWLQGVAGRQTLSLMGVPPHRNQPSGLADESKRVEDFLSRQDQLNWMMQLGDRVVGSIWVDLSASDKLPPPSVHLMIGDTASRGRGLGKAALIAVLDYLCKQGYRQIHSRYLIDNAASNALLRSAGFRLDGDNYTDADGLIWQNVVKEL